MTIKTGPRSSYHDSGKAFGRDSAGKYDEYELASSTRRESSRKYDSYEWRPSTRQEEKERSVKRGEKTAISVPVSAAIKLDTKLRKTEEVTKETARRKKSRAPSRK